MWLRYLDDFIVFIVYFVVLLTPVWNSVIDNDFLLMNRSSWLDGLDICKNKGGYFMANYDLLKAYDLNSLKNSSAIPLWLYGIEYRKNNKSDYIRLLSRETNMSARVICQNKSGETIYDGNEYTFTKSGNICQKSDTHVINMSKDVAYNYFFSRSDLNSTFWLGEADTPSFFEVNETVEQVACLLLDENGELRKDDCSKEHNVVCLKGDFRPTFQYTIEEIPLYVPPTDGSSTRTGTTAPSTDIISSSGGITHTDKQDPNTHTTVTNKREGFKMDMQLLYIVIGAAGGTVVLVMIIVCCCCCCCCRKQPEKGQGPQLSEVYSDAADSISMRQFDKKQTDYAVPEDAIRAQKARPRLSIGEDEYDTIQQTAKNKTLKPNANANVYSHVTVQNAHNRYENHSNDTPEESPYDVTSYGGKKAVVVVTDSTSEQYGHVQINTLP